MISPCDCSKKNDDFGRYHPTCLAALIDQLRKQLDAPEKGPPRCPSCGVTYRVGVPRNIQ